MRYLQKIVRNGNSSMVSLPKNAMAWCELITGQAIILDIREDKSITIRAAKPEDFLPHGAQRIPDESVRVKTP